MSRSFPLLEKFAEEKKDYSTLGSQIGMVASTAASPFLLSALNKPVPQEKILGILQDKDRLMSMYQDNYKDLLEVGKPAEEAKAMALDFTERTRKDAFQELIHKRNNPLINEVGHLSGKNMKRALFTMLGLGVALPIAGSLIGSKFSQKQEK